VNPTPENREQHLQELRLFLEELCCHLCRLQHMEADGVEPDRVVIHQEVYLGGPGLYADVKVQPPSAPCYFVEVKYGYPPERILANLRRKYGSNAPGLQGAAKVILVADTRRHADWPALQRQIAAALQPGLNLDVWDEEYLIGLLRRRFGLKVDLISEDNIAELKVAIDAARGHYAFGDDWEGNSLQLALLWHFSHWRVRQLREARNLPERAILPPGAYAKAIVLLADMCSFSSYVRDTPDHDIVRHALTTFYSKARYEVLNTGGMLYQFVGDQAIGLYGLPERRPTDAAAACACARALIDLGNSVSYEWQRQIDRIQNAQGIHIGMTIGDIQVVSLRPFGRAHLGAVSDGINMAARLLTQAGLSEIVVCNAFYQGLDAALQEPFQDIGAIDARNLGRIRAWKMKCA
jgi:class 3 adenylate cyclase